MFTQQVKQTVDALAGWSHVIVAGALMMSLGACSNTGPVNSGGGNVSSWVESAGADYIIDGLKNDPRFADSYVQLVHLDGDQITPEVSALGDELRRQLFTVVLRERGVNLVVRPAVQPWRAQRSLAEVDCGFLKPVTHIIGMDIQSGSSGERLSLKSLDLRSNQWLSGFETSWVGTFDSNQQVSAGVSANDVSLRGLRQFPFSNDESDLVASYLAQNLSCLLRQGAPERLQLHVASNPYGTPAYFNTVNTLVGRYMNQYREVDVIDSPEGANAVVKTDAVQIGNNLWQVWIGVAFAESGQRVTGAQTPAYALLDQTSLFNSGRVTLATRPEVADEPTRFPDPISAATPATTTSDTSNATVSRSTDAALNTQPSSSGTDSVSDSSSSTLLIKSFQAQAPISMDDCKRADPWAKGERQIAINEQLASDDCFAITASLSADSAFLIVRTSEQQWYRLVGSSCQSPAFQDPQAIASAGELRFPQNSTLGFSGEGSEETFYLITTRGNESTSEISSVISRLPDVCSQGNGSIRSPMDQINALVSSRPGAVLTKSLSVLRQRPS